MTKDVWLTIAGILLSSLVIARTVLAADVTPAQAESGLYQAHQAWQSRMVTLSTIHGQSDDLPSYAQKCDDATGITVPP